MSITLADPMNDATLRSVNNNVVVCNANEER